jgi:cysteine desulfurase/selenocysteine lyase
VDYLATLDRAAAAAYEQDLLEYATKRLGTVAGLRIVGTAAHKASVISFVLDGIHAHDVGTIVDQAGVAIRTGHHCTQPVMEFFGVPATARASLTFYNTREEVDTLVEALQGVRKVFG